MNERSWRRTLPLVLLALAPALGCRPPPPPRPAADPPPSSDLAIGREQDPKLALARASARFLAGYMERAPVRATALGEHSQDHRWPDLSAQGRSETLAWTLEELEGLAQLPREALDPDQLLELDLMRKQLELWQFSAEVEQSWVSDPLAYSGLISTGLDDLISREFAPIDDRAASVAARLERLPTLVDQAIVNLSDPALLRRPHSEVALAQFEGLRVLIEVELPKRTAAASPQLRERIARASPPALVAIERLRAQLEHLLPQASGRWRLGAEAFERKLRLTLHSEQEPAELLALARAEHQRVRFEMAALARELYLPMFGAKALARADRRAQGPDAQIRRVLDELAGDHASPEGLRESVEASLTRLNTFVREHALVPLDPDQRLEVIWTPPHARGVAIAGLAAPAPLDAPTPGLPSFYLVQPIPAAWDKDMRQSFLREYNSFMIEILSIHEAIPGHFVQLYWGARDPSIVRRVFQDGAFVEGWAVYAERLMVEAGYAGAGPSPTSTRPPERSEALWNVQTNEALRAKAIRLHGLKFYLRAVTNTILDHEIHAGQMSRAQALELMVERSFQERGEAEGKWVRAQVSSTQLSTYFVGAKAWFELRARAQARAEAQGRPFDVLEFHRAALSHGAPPLERLPELMGWE